MPVRFRSSPVDGAHLFLFFPCLFSGLFVFLVALQISSAPVDLLLQHLQSHPRDLRTATSSLVQPHSRPACHFVSIQPSVKATLDGGVHALCTC